MQRHRSEQTADLADIEPSRASVAHGSSGQQCIRSSLQPESAMQSTPEQSAAVTDLLGHALSPDGPCTSSGLAGADESAPAASVSHETTPQRTTVSTAGGATGSLTDNSSPGAAEQAAAASHQPLPSVSAADNRSSMALGRSSRQAAQEAPPGRGAVASAYAQFQPSRSDVTGNPAALPDQGGCLRPISNGDFEAAMQRVRPSITRDFTVELSPGEPCISLYHQCCGR